MPSDLYIAALIAAMCILPIVFVVAASILVVKLSSHVSKTYQL